MFDLNRILNMTARDIRRPDDLYEALDALAREIERVIGAYCLGPRQLGDLAQDLAGLRHSISMMLMDGTDRPEGGAGIVERYLDLEGRIKELRDNHAEK